MSKICLMTGVLLFSCGTFLAQTPPSDTNWSELIASMDKMHMAMGAVKRSGDSDVDFVRLMLSHHQAAHDMAKTQILHGKDPRMRRLAQGERAPPASNWSPSVLFRTAPRFSSLPASPPAASL